MAAPMVRQILVANAKNVASRSRGCVGLSFYSQTNGEKDKLESSPYFEKYADKIRKLQK